MSFESHPSTTSQDRDWSFSQQAQDEGFMVSLSNHHIRLQQWQLMMKRAPLRCLRIVLLSAQIAPHGSPRSTRPWRGRGRNSSEAVFDGRSV
jgi:hypothetical protein